MEKSTQKLFVWERTESQLRKLNKQYFHWLSDWEWNVITDCNPRITWEWINNYYRKPEWCSVDKAIDMLGCWGLISFMVDRNGKYCENCELKK